MANPVARPEDEDQTGVCWRDDQWLQFFPLTRQSALDNFSLSPFYDRSCNNEQAKLQGMDASKLACAAPLQPWLRRRAYRCVDIAYNVKSCLFTLLHFEPTCQTLQACVLVCGRHRV